MVASGETPIPLGQVMRSVSTSGGAGAAHAQHAAGGGRLARQRPVAQRADEHGAVGLRGEVVVTGDPLAARQLPLRPVGPDVHQRAAGDDEAAVGVGHEPADPAARRQHLDDTAGIDLVHAAGEHVAVQSGAARQQPRCLEQTMRAGQHRRDGLGLREAAAHRASAAICSGATSSQPASSREACWPRWRTQSLPMYTPRVRLRITAYHIVDASLGPSIRCQGRGGPSTSDAIPAATSWRPVAI